MFHICAWIDWLLARLPRSFSEYERRLDDFESDGLIYGFDPELYHARYEPLLEPSKQPEKWFTHRQLATNEIRLLKIFPSSLEKEVKFKVVHRRLDDESVKYTAVSYTWGDSKLTHVLVHNDTGQKLQVTSNCHQVIRRLRPSTGPALTLWIDAVCINQTDDKEREVQVSKMGEIYRRSKRVVAYLGEEADDSAQAMTYLTHPSLRIRSTCVPDTALKALLRRPWFSRIWVLQEVFNAPKLRLICGGHETDWDRLREYRWWRSAGRRDIYKWPLLMTIRETTKGQYSSKDLLMLLIRARHCGATDKKDKVYALLPLLRDATIQKLVPDYTLSVEQVYEKLAIFLARQHGAEFLCAVNHPPGEVKSSNLPSWVPRWDVDDERVPLWPDTGRAMAEKHDLDSDRRQTRFANHVDRFYSSGGPTDCHTLQVLPPAHASSHPQLRARGVYVARIHDLRSPEVFRRPRDRHKIWKDWKQIRGDYPMPYTRKTYTLPAAHPLHSSIDAAFRHMMWTRVVLPKSEEEIMHQRRENEGMHTLWREEVMGVVDGRMIMVTDDGRMGFAPPAARVGDHLCIFLGAPVPSILRQVDDIEDCFFLIGSCYIDGLMSKNAIANLEVSTAKSNESMPERRRDFVLV